MNLTSDQTFTHTKNELRKCWEKKTLSEEYTLHQLAPYIGKLKSSIAKGIIQNFTKIGDTIYDPYSGSGTIPLEAVANGRNVIANDLNPYAYLLNLAKLNPPSDLEEVLARIKACSLEVQNLKQSIDLRKTPSWVRSFFHRETFREVIAWVDILKRAEDWFLLSCLLGILHHQRPGFLSYPSSHTVPYLRIKKFPPRKFPDLYQYRDVVSRLEKKVKRAFKRMPTLHKNCTRSCTNVNANEFLPPISIDAIITSPPYMRSLDYARDNRLRLWFLDCNAWKQLDKTISPTEKDFLRAIKIALDNWKRLLVPDGKCILILGDSFCSSYKKDLPKTIEEIALKEVGGYKLAFRMRNLIPSKRRVRRNHQGNKYETIIVLEKTNNE